MPSRREVLMALGGLCFAGCKRARNLPASCSDTRGLARNEIDTRIAMGYRDDSTNPFQTCDACLQFVPPLEPGRCGTCYLIAGPIHPSGFCRAFTSKN